MWYSTGVATAASLLMICAVVSEVDLEARSAGLPAGAPPRRSGPLAVLRFWARNRMLTPKYALLVARLRAARLTPAGRRMKLDGMLFLGPG